MNSHAERQARIDLAACYRLSDQFGFNEGIDNHMTMLVPGRTEHFLLPPFGLHWSEIRASDFMVVDFNGKIVSGAGTIEPTALYIHQPVHRVAKAVCVMHTHMPHATALTMLENPRLEMAVQSAVGFHDDIAYDPFYNGLAYEYAEGERMAAVLGKKSVLMLSNHGVLVVGDTVSQAFERLYFLERAAQAQILALSTGRALKPVPADILQSTLDQFRSGAAVAGRDRAELHFEALKRILDRSKSDYAN
jgi:ribulose-5-phosphate 4-epimerase/fuculose-1-phosphate aldolase